MRKRLLLSFALLLSCPVFAQNQPGVTPNQTVWIDHPDVVIKGSELQNFPSGNLLEMLSGRLPGFNPIREGQVSASPLFVVDGIIWRDVSFININNIEEVAWYRGGLSGKFGVKNNEAGVLLITTKAVNFNQALQTTVHAQAGVGFLNGNQNDKKEAYLQSYQATMSEGLGKFAWSASAAYRNGYLYKGEADRDEQFQFRGTLTYAPLKWLTLNLSGNFAPNRNAYQWGVMRQARLDKFYTNQSLDLWNVFFNIKAEPVKGLVNEFNILKRKTGEDVRLLGISEYVNANSNSFLRDSVSSRLNEFNLMNNLSYTFGLDQGRVRIKASAIYQYESFKQDDYKQFYSYYYSQGNVQSSISETRQGSEGKLNSGVLDLAVNLYGIVALQGGVRGDDFNNKPELKTLYSPYYNARVFLKPLLFKNIGVINEFSLYSSFSQYHGFFFMKNSDGIINSYPNENRSKIQNYGVATSFFNNRFHLSGDWYRNNGGGLSNSFVYSDENFPSETQAQGWRIWSSVDLLREGAFKWNAGINVFRSKRKFTYDVNYFGRITFDDIEGAQMGLQQRFVYRNFTLDMNGYADFNQYSSHISNETNSSGFVQKRYSFINLNYVALGYRFNRRPDARSFKDFTLSLIGTNLIQDKNDPNFKALYRTLGLSLRTTL